VFSHRRLGRLADPAGQDLVEALPPVIHFNAMATAHAEWMQSTLQLMAVEARQLTAGGETIVTRLADILVVQALRTWLDHHAETQSGWLAALRDPQLGRALAAIHHDPTSNWTVASLAAASAMSLSAFAARFGAMVGCAPMAYLTRVRMRLARDLLGDRRLDVGTVAERVGYRSEAAFSRAFKRTLGISPGSARREAEQSPAPVTVS
jgi:transcriptional regulator GlxA family with amidase domain